MLCATLNGEFLPLQLMSLCIPQDWNVMFTPNHWFNEQKIKEYIENCSNVMRKCIAHGKTTSVIFDELEGPSNK